jgi:cytochrome c oxidase subunit II
VPIFRRVAPERWGEAASPAACARATAWRSAARGTPICVVIDTRHEFDRVAGLYLPIAVAVVALIALLALFMALRYRARPGEAGGPGRRPSRLSSAPRTELVYVALLACVAALLVWRTFTVEAKTDAVQRPAAVRIDVTAAKWHWTFDYPRYGIVQRGADFAAPTLVVPAGEVVHFTLRSVDVIHAFWIPARRFKRDANPAMVSDFTLVFPKTGFSRNGGECSEYCGLRHAQMRFNVAVLSPAAFARWAASGGRVGVGLLGGGA